MERRTFTEDEAVKFVTEDLLWGTAAGTTKDAKVAERFAASGMRIVEFGSITSEPREGNAGDNFYYDEVTGNSVNSWGIPNRGIDAYLPELPAIKKAVNDCGAQFWVSISAGDKFISADYGLMATALERADAADVIEGNFSCPNMIVNGKPKPNVCFDIGAFTRGVIELSNSARPKKVAVKLAPITEPAILRELVEICVKYDVDYIVMANTVGNCYLEKAPGVPAVTMVRGGLAGAGLRPIIKGMLMLAKPWVVGSDIKLIAVGGVEDAKTAYEYLALGADGFQFNTAITRRNYEPRSFVPELIYGESGWTPKIKGLVDILVERGLPIF